MSSQTIVSYSRASDVLAQRVSGRTRSELENVFREAATLSSPIGAQVNICLNATEIVASGHKAGFDSQTDEYVSMGMNKRDASRRAYDVYNETHFEDGSLDDAKTTPSSSPKVETKYLPKIPLEKSVALAQKSRSNVDLLSPMDTDSFSSDDEFRKVEHFDSDNDANDSFLESPSDSEGQSPYDSEDSVEYKYVPDNDPCSIQ